MTTIKEIIDTYINTNESEENDELKMLRNIKECADYGEEQ